MLKATAARPEVVQRWSVQGRSILAYVQHQAMRVARLARQRIPERITLLTDLPSAAAVRLSNVELSPHFGDQVEA